MVGDLLSLSCKSRNLTSKKRNYITALFVSILLFVLLACSETKNFNSFGPDSTATKLVDTVYVFLECDCETDTVYICNGE